jgi:predicted DNA-binding antitoxin AbrB/MazE fold protein
MTQAPIDPRSTLYEAAGRIGWEWIFAGDSPLTITVRAVYEHGVLRPVEPLSLPEGEAVDVTIATAEPAGPVLRPPTPTEKDYAHRIKAARSLEEIFAVMATAPGLPEGYDLIQALNANRTATGERPPFAASDDGSPT